MKVALFTKKFTTRTGNERVATQVAKNLHEHGHDVRVYCQKSDSTAEELIPESRIFRLRGLSFDPTISMWTFAKKAKETVQSFDNENHEYLTLGFNHTVTQDVYRLGGGTHRGFMDSTEFGGRSGGPVVNRMAQNLENQRFRDSRCAAYIVPSQKIRQELKRYYDIDEARVHTIYNGVNLEKFHPCVDQQKTTKLHEAWRIKSTEKIAIFIGQDLRIKGFEQAVSATKKVGCRLVYIGKARRPSKLESHVIWAGERTDVADCIRACDALILPSYYESFSNVTLEALACGVPVVITKQVGASELLSEDVFNKLIAESPADLDGLVLGLDTAFSNGDELSNECRAIAEKYGVEKFYQRFEKVLSNVYERNH